MSNPFYDPDDEVDDDEFLRHPRAGRAGYMLPNAAGGSSPNPPPSFGAGGGSVYPNAGRAPPTADEMRQQMLQKKREIEERTLESSSRSVGLLYESEKVGQATAEELARQKEQLKATEGRLDDINSTLKQSERHLQGIKSVFGGIRNYFSGRGAAQAAQGGGATGGGGVIAKPMASSASGHDFVDTQRADDMRKDAHPGMRMRGLHEQPQARGGGSSVDDVLDQNLEEMSMGLSRLKGLAQNLNTELEEHNEIIDRLDHKTSNTQWRVDKQNKDMNKILKK